MMTVRLIVNNLRDILFVILFFKHAGVRFRSTRRHALAVGILMLLMLMSPTDISGALLSAALRTLYRGALILSYLMLSQSMDRVTAVYYSFFASAIIVVCHNVVFTQLTRPMFLFEVSIVDNTVLNALLCMTIINILTVGLYDLVYRLLSIDFSERPSPYQVLNMTIVLGTATYLNGQMKVLSMSTEAQMTEYSVFSIMLQISLLFCLVFNENLSYNIKQRMAVQAQLTQARLLQKSIEQKAENEEALKAIRHNIKNHLSAIRYFINEKGDEQAQAYIDTLIGAKAIASENLQTGNGFLDSLFQEKLDRIDNMRISTDIRANLNALNRVEPIDLCVIFGNVLDNAVEACELVEPEERLIVLRSIISGGYLTITVENSYNGKTEVLDRLPLTTKRDRQFHGIGLRQVRKTLQKYDGVFTINADRNKRRFSVFISFPAERLR